ncbi:hypothetical protein [Microbispora sp. NPDC046933]|uniref:hypothetical protein n=1 Tax=Microbispora sp. NPDC046933 TaxID=3155618 RepID=UPI0033E95D9F
MTNPPSRTGKADQEWAREGANGLNRGEFDVPATLSTPAGRGCRRARPNAVPRTTCGGLESLPALPSPDEREQLPALLARLPHSMAALRDA